MDSESSMGTDNLARGSTDEVTRVRRWLEEAWRHGEIVKDDDQLETHSVANSPNRFEVSSQETREIM